VKNLNVLQFVVLSMAAAKGQIRRHRQKPCGEGDCSLGSSVWATWNKITRLLSVYLYCIDVLFVACDIMQFMWHI